MRIAMALAAGALLALPVMAVVPEMKGLASKGTTPAFKSASPKYAQIAMNEDKSKVLSVVFDESRGTGRGYDTLYVLELDDQGKVAKSEACVAAKSMEKDTAVYGFKPIDRPVAFKNDMKGGKRPFSAVLEYRRTETKPERPKTKDRQSKDAPRSEAPHAVITEEFNMGAVISLNDGKSEWAYTFIGKLPVSDSIESCTPLVVGEGPVTMSIDSERPDPKKVTVGVGVDFSCGDHSFACAQDGKPALVDINIKDDKGKRIAGDQVRQDNLAFKMKSRTISTAAGCAPGG